MTMLFLWRVQRRLTIGLIWSIVWREKLETGGREHVLSSQKFADGKVEDGYRYLSEFSYEDTPVWRFHVNGVEIVKEAAMKNGENTIVHTYSIINRTREKARADCYTVLSVCLKRKRT